MKFAALVSGGKDSIYSIQESIRNGHELICCIHLAAPLVIEEESFMYQTAGSNVVPVLIEECLGVPLILHRRTGKSLNVSMIYLDDGSNVDEVEDLYAAIKTTVHQYPEIQAISSGAILSNYQRVRIEHVCSRLGLTSLSYLWRLAPQHQLLKRMLEDGIEAVVVKTACPPGLVPSKHLNKTLRGLYDSGLLDRLYEKYRFHFCGEGGEYETLVLDCPLFKKRLVLDEVEINETEDGIGELMIRAFHSEDKVDTNVTNLEATVQRPQREISPVSLLSPCLNPFVRCLSHVQHLSGGLLHFSEVMSHSVAQVSTMESEADLAVQESIQIFEILRKTLSTFGCNSLDVILVHVYLSEISHFANINEHYRSFFGAHLPPSRSTIAVGRNMLPGGRRVMLDCIAQIGSGDFMRGEAGTSPYARSALQTKTSDLRQVLHVQSISNWAPVCIGPYSQVNTLRSCVHFVAGQIGLDPPTMKLKHGLRSQLVQAWTNTARILDCLEGASLGNLLSCLIYVSYRGVEWSKVAETSREMILSNGDVVPGAVDDTISLGERYGGYEDEETWREMTKDDPNLGFSLPLLMVAIDDMPLGALVEVETVSLTQRARSCLELRCSFNRIESFQTPRVFRSSNVRWSTGHDFQCQDFAGLEISRIEAATVSLGVRCVAMCTVAAWVSDWVDPDNVLCLMIDQSISSLESASLSLHHALNVRFYYASGCAHDQSRDDGLRWRSSLSKTLAVKLSLLSRSNPVDVSLPAISVVPVKAMNFATDELHDDGPSIAMQIMAIDPVHMETEVWIHHGRDI